MALTIYQGKEAYINKEGTIVLSDNENYDFAGWIGFRRGLAPVCKRKKRWNDYDYDSLINNIDEFLLDFYMAFINKQGDVVTNWYHGEFGSIIKNYFTVKDIETRYSGLYDLEFNEILPCKYHYISYVNDDGTVYVSKGEGRNGIFDTHKREFIIPCQYEIDYNFNEGLIPVRINDKSGFLDKSRNIAIEPKYDSATGFSEGFSVVTKYGVYGFVDRYGNDTFD